MIKNFVMASAQGKINSLKPAVAIKLNRELPIPSLKESAKFAGIVSKIVSYEKEVEAKPAEFFKEKTQEYRRMIQEKIAGLTVQEYMPVLLQALDEFLPYYFAMIRESARRTIRLRHFDVQMLGGIILHNNRIAEMTTGEGKTLVATLAASLNALAGKGVHVVTVNDYLARRDMEWMRPVYEYLGYTVGVIQQDMDNQERRYAYGCDITYGTNNEFGFDYLRDNMVNSLDQMVQHQGHFFAIVDEVDSILVDEARTPLIISGPAEMSTDKYYLADRAVRQLKTKFVISSFENKEGMVIVKNRDGSEQRMEPAEFEKEFDAIVEEKNNNAYLTAKGEKRCEQILGVKSVSDESPDSSSNPWMHYLTQSLRAHNFFEIEKEYIIKDGKVVIVDEFTGRLMPGRRWSDGLHQAIEAKENMRIQEESQTLATITLQNYFRMYKKLAGMTGTAYTEANEFKHIYKLDVTAMPTNRPLIRINNTDRIYKSKKGKFEAVINEIGELYAQKRPVLVGTTSIADSELLSFMLEKKGISHNVLNAKQHEREAHIVAQAGRLGQITIATNMAGRGTDIVLGGSLDFFIKDLLQKNGITSDQPEYKDEYEKLYSQYKPQFDQEHEKVVGLGGLHVIGTQRHESRRIDNQLRGRCGRQGDPGSSRFYVSLEDDLMRLFGSERIYQMMDSLGFPENEAIEHPIVNHSLEIAQKRVEGHNFEIRKQLLDYDNVMNKQREVIYGQRRQILEKENIREEILGMMEDVVTANAPEYFGEKKDPAGFCGWLKKKFGLETTSADFEELDGPAAIELAIKKCEELYCQREQDMAEEMRGMEKMAALWIVDSRWKEHLLIIDSLKEGIHLRGYAQVEPLIAYQKESFAAFEEMIASIKDGVVELVFKTRMAKREAPGVFESAPKSYTHSEYNTVEAAKASAAGGSAPEPEKITQVIKKPEERVGRNDPCPCGSGKKYKKCCGK